MNDNANVPPKFALSDGEKISPVLSKLQAHLKDRLANARSKNDNTQLSEVDTAVLRGQIKELRYLIALGEDAKVI